MKKFCIALLLGLLTFNFLFAQLETEPGVQVTSLAASNITQSSITLTWINSTDADSTIIYADTPDLNEWELTDGDSYAADSYFGNGGCVQYTTSGPPDFNPICHYVVYKGTGTSVTITGLSKDTRYRFMAFAFNSTGSGTENYLNSYGTNYVWPYTTNPPTVISNPASSTSNTSSTLGGNITDQGSSAITERGVVYSITATNSNPVFEGTGVSSDAEGGTTTGIFSETISTFNTNTQYSFRAYAINSSDTAYGDVLTFTTSVSIITSAASSIDSTQASLGGNITNDGDQTITKRGICYSLASANTNPEIEGTGVIQNDNGAGDGPFSETITNLESASEYYFKAFAIRSQDTTYGSAQSFTTLAEQARDIVFSSVQDNQMTLTWTNGSGNKSLVVARQGSGTITNPNNGTDYNASNDFSNPASPNGSTAAGHNVIYNGTGNSVTVTGLDAATLYSFKVYEYTTANNTYQTADGSSGNPSSNSTTGTPPSLVTNAASSISHIQATLGGNISDAGSSSITDRGVLYSITATNSNPVFEGTGVSSDAEGGTTTGIFSETISTFNTNTQYSFRAYAINSSDTAYGNVLTFTTSVSISTSEASSIDSTQASLGGNITNDGDQTITKRGICYSLASANTNPEINGTGVIQNDNGAGDGLFSETITNLESASEYYFKAFAIRSQDTTYGSAQSFTTLAEQARDIVFSSVQDNQMTLTWTNGSGNKSLVIARQGSGTITNPNNGTDYNASNDFSNPASPNGSTAAGHNVIYNGTGNSVTVTGLNAATLYSFKVYEYTTANTTYQTSDGSSGNPNSESTTGTPPSLVTNAATGVSYIEATLGGNISEAGSSAIINRGVVYSVTATNSTPVINGSGVTQDSVGNPTTGSFSELINNLSSDTEYSFRAYAINSSDTAYGSILTFTTLTVSAPSISNTAATSVGIRTATIGGNVTNDGGASVTERGVVYSSTDTDPEIGNPGVTQVVNGSGTGSFTKDISNLTPNTTYYFKAYAINSANTSYGAPVENFTTDPLTQATGISFSSIQGDQMTLTWTIGDGDGRIVVAKNGSAPTAIPANGISYTANASFGDGQEITTDEFVIYNGSSNTVTVSNLEGLTNYHFKVYESLGSGENIVYQTSNGASNNPNDETTIAKSAPSLQASNASIDYLSMSSIRINWSNGNGENRIVVVRATADARAYPTNNTTYAANTVFGVLGSTTGTGNYVVYNGNAENSITVTGLSSATSYTAVIYEYNNPSGNETYNTSVTASNSQSIVTTVDITWDGNTDNDWNTADNWDVDIVPGSSNNIIIPSSASNQPIIGTSESYTINDITIDPGAYLTINNGAELNVSGNALLKTPTDAGMPGQVVITGSGSFNAPGNSTLERRILVGSRHLASSPISSYTITDNRDFSINEFIENPIAWKKLANGATLNVMQGYNLGKGTDGPDTIVFVGTFNNGNYSIDIQSSNTSNEDYGWNLIGNPYPSSIDLKAASGIDLSDADGFVYVYDSQIKDYITYELAVEPSIIVPPVQAFFVHTSNTSGTVSITNAARVSNAANFKSATLSKPTIEINVENELANSTNTYIKFHSEGTADFDPKHDGLEMLGYNNDIPDAYTILDNNFKLFSNTLSGDTLSMLGKDTCFVKLGIQKGSASTLKISLNSLKEIPDDIAISLIDKLNKKETNLRTDSYEFSADGFTDSQLEIALFKVTVEVNSITISSNITGDSVEAGNTIQLAAEVLPLHASIPQVTWSINNPSIATIDANSGLLTTISVGDVIVTASAIDGSGITNTFNVKVYNSIIPVSSISISHNATGDSVGINTNLQLNATLLPSTASDTTFTWISDNPDLAQINQTTGLLSALAEGTVNITATANDGYGANTTIALKIYNPAILADSITITAPSDSVEINETMKFEATVYPNNASNQTYSWSVNNTEIASINESTGLLSSKSAGTVDVIATANDNSGVSFKFKLVIYENVIPVESIAIKPTIDSLEINNNLQLSAAIYPENASNQTFTWSLNNSKIASINSLTGSLSTKSTGTVIVYAITNDGSNKSDSVSITIYEPVILVDSIKINQTVDSVKANNTIQMTAAAYPANATNTTFKWSVSNTDIATINKTSGLLTTKATGIVDVVATANDNSGVYASITLNVYLPNILVDSLSIEGLPDSVETNKSIDLSAMVYPANASNQLYLWSIDNNEIASIDENTGKLTTQKVGALKVTATAKDQSGRSTTRTVTIYQSQIAVENISILTDVDSIEINSTTLLQVQISPNNASNQTVEWSSEDDKIVSVDNTGLLSARALGTTTITAASSDNSKLYAAKTITVYSANILVSEIVVEGSDSLLINKSAQYTSDVIPSNASNLTVTWEVNNPELASINQTGLLTAKKSGAVIVTAKANDGSGINGSFTVNIYNITSLNGESFEDFIKFYPNPAMGNIHIESQVSNGEFTIIDNVGKTLLKDSFNKKKDVNISKLKQGTYFIVFTKGNKKQVNVLIKK